MTTNDTLDALPSSPTAPDVIADVSYGSGPWNPWNTSTGGQTPGSLAPRAEGSGDMAAVFQTEQNDLGRMAFPAGGMPVPDLLATDNTGEATQATVGTDGDAMPGGQVECDGPTATATAPTTRDGGTEQARRRLAQTRQLLSCTPLDAKLSKQERQDSEWYPKLYVFRDGHQISTWVRAKFPEDYHQVEPPQPGDRAATGASAPKRAL